MNVKYPLIYNGYSRLIRKPYFIIVVNQPGEFSEHVALKKKQPLHTSSNYNDEGAHVFDDPSTGRFFLPIGSLNELQIETRIIEGASEEQIALLLKDLASVTFEEVGKAFDERG